MKNPISALSLSLVLGFSVPAIADQPADPAQVPAQAPEISAQALRAHIEFLADDLTEGRRTGTRGYDIAARYVASMLAAAGLQPAGDDGSWFQNLTTVEGKLVEDSAEMILRTADGQELPMIWQQDFLIGGSYADAETLIDAPVTFVGYGITAPELAYDDYAGLDVRGHVVAFFGGAPEDFPGDQRAYYSSRSKLENAASRGAVGTVSFNTREAAERRPWEDTINAYQSPGMRWVDDDGSVQGLLPPIRGGAMLSPDGLSKLLAGSGQTRDQLYDAAETGQTKSMTLPVEMKLYRRSEQIPYQSHNVVGVLPGSDPALASEYVVMSGHLDHLGIGVEYDGDGNYNGAYDNATGIAIMLEVARALATNEPRPARSILFLAVTGEEQGLLGSDYFANHPTVPLSQIVANINLDMPIFTNATNDIVAFGAEHSSLAGPTALAAEAIGMTLAPDPLPEEVIFIRSDQYSFVRQGVPAVYLMPGMTATDPTVSGGSGLMDFLKNHYHKPSDELDLQFDPDAAVRFTRLNYLLIREIADQPQRPTWNAGDFFGDLFARPAGATSTSP
ncbi:MAG: M28 family metallopeptidase [Gammaproteobacteria bacterium]